MVGLLSAIVCCGLLIKNNKKTIKVLDLDPETRFLLLSLQPKADDIHLEPYRRKSG